MLDASIGGKIQGSEGTIIQFSTDAFLNEVNEKVTGTIAIERIDIYSRSSMLLTEKANVGIKFDDGKAVLISGGEF